ncbi:MAG TPA: type I restriction-modification system endonuclease [Longimicrobiaceae bacterium]
MQSSSVNFAFLGRHDPLLVRLAGLAELYSVSDPNTALFKLRQFGEALLQRVAANAGITPGGNGSQHSLIRELSGQGVLPREVADLFHLLRQSGNEAVHEFGGTRGEVVHQLKIARDLGVWFHRTFADPEFNPGAFVRPEPPADPTAELQKQLEQLRDEVEEQRRQMEEAGLTAELAEELRLEAERRVHTATEDREAALGLAGEMEALLATERARLQAELSAVRQAAARRSDEQLDADRARSRAAVERLLDESETRRRLIDQQLRDAGWEANSEELRFGKGTRPERGRNLAIAEWPTATGPADYVLFAGLTRVGVVEAKRQAINVAGSIEQAKRYSRGYTPQPGDVSPGGPWGEYRIPFLFATNGRAYLAQIAEQSGVWFLDARRPTNHPRALQGWYSPEGLKELLKQDVQAAEEALRESSANPLPLRDYQRDAVEAVEAVLLEGQRSVLVAMATGTGKTRTAVGMLYRLLRAGYFRRILFLVDRNALGEQALGSFGTIPLEGIHTFSDVYEVAPVDRPADDDTRLDIATVQGMVKRVLYADPAEALPVDTYDCIVVDECHRGYALDREMSEAELTFRSEADYVSKYRRLIEYFDAVKIGLTATPAKHTTEIFGRPVYQYSYRQAVIDGWLVDHEPPTRIVTHLSEDGITWRVGEPVQVYDVDRAQIDVFEAPDEIRVEVEEFNRRVVTENFNRAVCGVLAREIDPQGPGKTLIYCVDDEHADRVVRLLKGAFDDVYGGVDEEAVKKITGKADHPSALIRRFKNERLPAVAVTVDLLTTGIDVPEIANLVFLRRIRSRILYEQMLGRATRLSPDLYGPGEDKTLFRIFDAVDLYAALQAYSEMHPVVVNPSISFTQLAAELLEVKDETARTEVRDQLVAKLRRARVRLERHRGDEVESLAGLRPKELADRLAHMDPAAAAEFFAERPGLPSLLDAPGSGPGRRRLISEHPDEVRRVEHGYGNGQRPADYLESFGEYLRTHINEIPALQVVLQRPRDLTRAQLRELALALDQEGYSEATLRTAWRDATNQDIAASIIGYVRQAALGEPLLPYEERVKRAVQRILGSRYWTEPQRRWLRRIGEQMLRETVVDRPAFDSGQFRQEGGFRYINRIFEGQLEQLVGDLHDEVWRTPA